MKPILVSVLAALLALSLGSCGKKKKEETTRERIIEFYSAFYDYVDENGAWPEKLEDLKEYVDNWDELIVNPVTGDNPGYKYNRPPEGTSLEDDDGAGEEGAGGGRKSDRNFVILEQLRDGSPDPKLRKLTVGGRLRK